MRLFVYFFHFSFLIVISQNISASKVDSLQALINKTKDTTVFQHYHSLINELMESPDSALFFSDEALKLAHKRGSKIIEARLHTTRGLVLDRLGRLDESLNEFQVAYNLYKELKDKYLTAKSCIQIGAILMDLGKYDEASQKYFESLERIDEQKHEDLASQVYTNIGVLFLHLKNYEQSIMYYQKSIPLKIKLNKMASLALAYNNIGISYYYMGLFDSVLVNFKRSLKIYEDIGDRFRQAMPLSNIGEIYYTLGENEKALEYYHRALEIELEIGYKPGYSITMMAIGDVFTQQGDYNKALDIQYKALDTIKTIGSLSKLMDGYEYLYETYNSMNQSDSALYYFKNYVSLKDSIFNLEKNQQITELEKIYQTEKKDNEILKLEQEREKKRALTVFLIILSTLLAMMTSIIYIYYKAKNKALTLKTKTLEQKRQFSAVLNAQEDERKRIASDLHDSVGPLLSVSQLYISDVSGSEHLNKELVQTLEKTNKVLNDAMNEIRDISHNLMPAVLVRSGLIPACRELLRRVKSTKCAKVTFDMSGKNARYNESIEISFYRILQELVNNILKHAHASKIHVELKEVNNKLVLKVLDDGVGLGNYQFKNPKGIGLQNINSRLTLINGQIKIHSSQNSGTDIQVSAPIVIS